MKDWLLSVANSIAGDLAYTIIAFILSVLLYKRVKKQRQFIGPRPKSRLSSLLDKFSVKKRLVTAGKMAAVSALSSGAIYGLWQIEFGRETMMIISAACLGILLSLPLVLILIYKIAENDKHLTFVPTGEIKIKVWGKTIVEALVNVPGKRWNKELDLIEDGVNGNIVFDFLEKVFGKYFKYEKSNKGIFFVSWFYPMGKIATWKFSWPKLQPKTHEEAGKNVLDGYEVVQEEKEVNSLFYQYPYPVKTTEIELQGNFKINLLVRVILTVKKPMYLIGNLKGKFMPQVILEVSGILDNGLRDMDPWNFMADDKEAIVARLLPVGEPLLNGAFEIAEAAYVGFDWTGNSNLIMEAISAKEVAEKQGLAQETAATHGRNVAKIQGETTVINAKAKAEADTMLVNVEVMRTEKTFALAAMYPGGMAVLQQRAASEGLEKAVDNLKPGANLVLGGNALVNLGNGGVS